MSYLGGKKAESMSAYMEYLNVPSFIRKQEPKPIKDKILSLEDRLPIGKHRGKLICDLIREELSYITWIIANTDWELDTDATSYYERKLELKNTEKQE